MHLSDGVLPVGVAAGGYVCAVAISALTARKTNKTEIPRVAVMTAAFFAASLIHVPIPPSSAHLVLSGLIGIVLGRLSFISIFVGLIFQAIMFQHGGILTLGVNALNMGIPALIAGSIFRHFKKYLENKPVFSASLAGVLSALAVILSSLAIAAELIFTGMEFAVVSKTIVLVNSIIGVIEGVITFFIFSIILKVKPQIVYGDLQEEKS